MIEKNESINLNTFVRHGYRSAPNIPFSLIYIYVKIWLNINESIKPARTESPAVANIPLIKREMYYNNKYELFIHWTLMKISKLIFFLSISDFWDDNVTECNKKCWIRNLHNISMNCILLGHYLSKFSKLAGIFLGDDEKKNQTQLACNTKSTQWN